MKEPSVRILLYSSGPRGPEKLLSTSLVPESLAHDELRDLLHSVGVEKPERAILEGGPVFDVGMTNQIRWEVEELAPCPYGCETCLDIDSRCQSCNEKEGV